MCVPEENGPPVLLWAPEEMIILGRGCRMVSVLRSFGLNGIDAFPVMVEVDVSTAMPSFDLVGLPDAAVKEARDRVLSFL